MDEGDYRNDPSLTWREACLGELKLCVAVIDQAHRDSQSIDNKRESCDAREFLTDPKRCGFWLSWLGIDADWFAGQVRGNIAAIQPRKPKSDRAACRQQRLAFLEVMFSRIGDRWTLDELNALTDIPVNVSAMYDMKSALGFVVRQNGDTWTRIS